MPVFDVQMTRRAGVRFEDFPERLRVALTDRIERLTDELYSRVLAAEPMRTGALRAETQRFVDSKTDFVRGRVRVLAKEKQDLLKAVSLEYGASKPTKVRSYTRQQDYLFGRAVEPFEVIVHAFTRRPNVAAVRFLRDPIEQMSGRVREELRAAIAEAEVE